MLIQDAIKIKISEERFWNDQRIRLFKFDFLFLYFMKRKKVKESREKVEESLYERRKVF